jgi:hypothetical protein
LIGKKVILETSTVKMEIFLDITETIVSYWFCIFYRVLLKVSETKQGVDNETQTYTSGRIQGISETI